MWETWVWSLGWEDPLEKEMATHSSILPWRIPWTEEPGGLQSMGLQRVGHDWGTSTFTLSYLRVMSASFSRWTSGIFPWKFASSSAFLLRAASFCHSGRAPAYFKFIYVRSLSMLENPICIKMVESDCWEDLLINHQGRRVKLFFVIMLNN